MKRTIGIAVSAFGLTAGSLLIASPAQASAACDSAYRAATAGHVYAYNLNKGIEYGYSTVRFSNCTPYDTANGYGCLKRGEWYADTLWDQRMSNGSPGANSIS
ncbi:hypothetical protein [Streptomyces sp. NPDC048442]|uniref:hypothetical protein n=1 Tax=Streptomyces sp. NPDC048442 TaxID=3154823 RepID=UPI0034462A1B